MSNEKLTKRRPMVSILLITYNHEKYIGQAIQGILNQETEFDYEINVIEDCSTDRTQEVVMEYVQKFPDKVKPFFNKKNCGFKVTQKNLMRDFLTLTGKYIAILEGDDYWTAPDKLQKQISYLEANPEYVACAHNTIKVYQDGSRDPHRFLYRDNIPAVATIDDLISLDVFFHTTTLLYRNVFNGKPPKQFANRWSCDIFNTIAHAQYGNIRYFNDDMAVYRAHSGGRFSGMNEMAGWLFNIYGLCHYNRWLGYRYLKQFSKRIYTYCEHALANEGMGEVGELTLIQTTNLALVQLKYQLIFSLCDTPSWLSTLRLELQREANLNAQVKALIRHARAKKHQIRLVMDSLTNPIQRAFKRQLSRRKLLLQNFLLR